MPFVDNLVCGPSMGLHWDFCLLTVDSTFISQHQLILLLIHGTDDTIQTCTIHRMYPYHSFFPFSLPFHLRHHSLSLYFFNNQRLQELSYHAHLHTVTSYPCPRPSADLKLDLLLFRNTIISDNKTVAELGEINAWILAEIGSTQNIVLMPLEGGEG